MAHITLSIPDEIYDDMKSYSEIKWSEIARKSIIEKILMLKGSLPGKEFFKLLPSETQEGIRKTSKKEWIKFYEKVREKEWGRKKYLIQV